MTSPHRIAVLSAWHVHAEEYGRAAQEHPDTELVALWDDDATRGQEMADKLGVEFVPSLDDLLARDDLDGVTVTTATTAHSEVIGAAIAAGKHIFTEKLLAPTVEECDRLVEAAREKGVALTVSLPRLFHGYTLALRAVLDSGELGDLTYSRVRLSHNGSVADWLPARFYDAKDTIGGAFTDLGAHPVYLTNLILGGENADGRYASVRSTFTDVTGRGVEDNASVTVSTEAGAIGVLETGFVSGLSPFSIEIEGTRGGLRYGFEGRTMTVTSREGSRSVEVPEDAATPFQRWVTDLQSGTPVNETLAPARALTALLVAANAAAAH
ncbi:Gfo/Idh/MocA family protein [Aestuariimicrobium sp. T2.26MG-19.2B]|uniref:Gfo/Idh/MocA family protein n=1 Tax=Aestuariimicrobium sp. T2.26MG-19.2B TaxID=3040679 RepID=UPI002477A717|nr:Gfo/Idh/MocA family oxidoreductase [Aestuariimicrobium sp. T2.26MG-19.2B]CAI9409441.1 Inositol 2-dehydrogenase/D-chiro-inositol 3-dehydrogenase [Aestuariimicrobium sp. T2.26MG-19.2B]